MAGARIATKREVEMAHAETDERLERLEALVRRDPAGRGLISSEVDRGVLCAGHFTGAVNSLLENPGPLLLALT